MAVSKVILNGTTLIDVTQDTVASGNLLTGNQATGADGEKVQGAYVAPTFTTQAKTNISPTTSSQTITPDAGYDGLSSVQINAMPSGTAGTPTATKGTVSNNSVAVTPAVTNTAGYISGGTINGTAVTVFASELVSGTMSITENGTGIDVTNYATVDVSVSGGGGDGTSIYTYNHTVLNNSEVTMVASGAFAMCSTLQTVSLPSVSSVGASAFWSCAALSEANLSRVQKIDIAAFQSCVTLASVSIPEASNIGQNAFAYCSALTEIDLPKCSTIGLNAFMRCSNLSSVSGASHATIFAGAFSGCFKLTYVEALSTVASIGANAFAGCGFSYIKVDNATNIDSAAFADCASLTEVDLLHPSAMQTSLFASCTNLEAVYIASSCKQGIYSSAFLKCYNLKSLYLLQSSVVNLRYTNVFSSTPISNYTTSTGGVYGSVFVPESLYNYYVGVSTSTGFVPGYFSTTYSARIASLTSSEVSDILRTRFNIIQV